MAGEKPDSSGRCVIDTGIAGMNPAVYGQQVEYLTGRIENLIRRQQGTLAVVFSLLIAGIRHFPEFQRRIVHAFIQYDGRVFRKVIIQAAGTGIEQRQVVFDARRCDSVADVSVNRVAAGVPAEPQTPVTAEQLDCRRGQGDFPGRQHPDFIGLIQGPLGFYIENPDTVNLVIEQVNPERDCGTHGIDIDERTSYGHVAMLHDLGHGTVTVTVQFPPEDVRIQGLPGA